MFQGEASQKHKNGTVFSKVVCVNKLLQSNFIQGPLLITSEGLTLIVVESVKFRDVSERKQPKTQKRGELIKHGGALRKLHPEYSRRGW